MAPTVFTWEPKWEWLANFPGTNGPVRKLVTGKQDLQGALFIGGSFDNLPSLLLWNAFPQKFGYGNLTVVGGKQHSLSGLVTAIVETYLPSDNRPTDHNHNNFFDDDTVIRTAHDNFDYTFMILLACVGIGIFIGLCFTLSCFSRFSYPPDPSFLDDENLSAESQVPMSLKTLSADGQGGNAVDFKECFERAMKFRHLPTYETLIIINPKEILLSKIIGEGSFGRVWSGTWRNNAVAVKEFVFAQAAIAGGSLQRNNIIEEIVGEAGVMACLRHPKILQLYGCSLTMQAIWIVSELCARGSLKMLLMDHHQELPLFKRLSILIDVADGMQYLHNRVPPIIHRDLKSHNIFISELSPGNFIAKIGDWGSARAIALTGSKSMTQGVGTACWLSPEVINNAHFSKSSDVYAFGMILWEVYTRQEIYEGLSAAQIIAKVAHEGLRPQVPRHCPWSKIMTQCWKQDPAERPDFEGIVNNLAEIQTKYSQRLKERKEHHQQQQQQLQQKEQQQHQPHSPQPQIVPLHNPFYQAAATFIEHNERDLSGNSTLSAINEEMNRYMSTAMNTHYNNNLSNRSNNYILNNNNSHNPNNPFHKRSPDKPPSAFPFPPGIKLPSETTMSATSRPPTIERPSSKPTSPITGGGTPTKRSHHYPPHHQHHHTVHQHPRADSFHPSLENLTMLVPDKDRNSGGNILSMSSSRSVEEVIHLAPELAQLEMESLLKHHKDAELNKNTFNNRGGYFMSPDENGELHQQEDDEADPIDFLFKNKKLAASVGGGSGSGSGSKTGTPQSDKKKKTVSLIEQPQEMKIPSIYQFQPTEQQEHDLSKNYSYHSSSIKKPENKP
jgi:hypothetical protein